MATVTKSQFIPKVISTNRQRAELTTATVGDKCSECGFPIVPESDYYEVSSAVTNIHDRVHVHCIEAYLEVLTAVPKGD